VTEDADVLERSVFLILESRLGEARAVLTTLPPEECFPLPEIDATAPPFKQLDRLIERPLGDHQRFAIYERDGWRCRYCQRKIVVAPILRLLRLIFEDFKGADDGYHLPTADTEPGVIRVYPHVDHVHPQKFGGDNSEVNLATACDRCNTAKADRPGWTRLPIVRDDWRGLFPSLRALADIANHSGAKSWLKLADAEIRRSPDSRFGAVHELSAAGE
jgi:5-methylcytosine-specific restriction endonuclease McrA